jgi:hypothetical protein
MVVAAPIAPGSLSPYNLERGAPLGLFSSYSVVSHLGLGLFHSSQERGGAGFSRHCNPASAVEIRRIGVCSVVVRVITKPSEGLIGQRTTTGLGIARRPFKLVADSPGTVAKQHRLIFADNLCPISFLALCVSFCSHQFEPWALARRFGYSPDWPPPPSEENSRVLQSGVGDSVVAIRSFLVGCD